MRARALVLGGVLVAGIAGAAGAAATGGAGLGALTGPSGSPLPSRVASTASTTSGVRTAPVQRGTIETSADLDGSLGYEGDRVVAAGGPGTVTRLPAAGAIVRRNGVLFELDGGIRPRLLYGQRPMWRPLRPGMSDGADVLQLERNLKALGHAPAHMKVDRHWDAKTTLAVRRWQRATGRTADGTLDASDLVFLPGAIRVASLAAAVGDAVGPGAAVLRATSTGRVVTLSVSASRQDLVTAGQAVSIELPDGSSVGGHIREVGRVAATDQQGSTTLPVTIDIDRGAVLPDLDAAPVTVHVVTERHEGVLTVPVNALVALLEGGYAVEVVAPDGSHRYVGVTIGLFQDGRVEVGATGLAEGDAVVVAR